MRTWSDRPFPDAVPYAEVAGRGAVLSRNAGESQVIYEISRHPGWLVKRYLAPLPAERSTVLGRVIDLPGQMTMDDRRLVDRAAAWPVARVTEGPDTVGVIMARAPAQFYCDATVTASLSKRIALTVDHLALPEARSRRLGIPPLTPRDRLVLIRDIVAVGELLQREGLVYGDWSYTNAMWSASPLQALIIDMDSCGFVKRRWVTTSSWDDPLVPDGAGLTDYTDRYKLALLAVRGLTGERFDDQAGLAALPDLVRGTRLEQVLAQCLLARSPTARPSLPELLSAIRLVLADRSGSVTGWRDLAGPAARRKDQPT